MKTKIKIWQLFLIIAGISLFIVVSCTKNDTSSSIYSTNDLQGIWTGSLKVEFHGGDNDGLINTITKSLTFNANGKLDSIKDHPVFLSNTGNLQVSSEGQITGTITTTHNTNPGIETTSENWTGCVFETKSKIKANMVWSWTNTRPGNGYYIISGELTKQ
jgi:hypothetical protein